MYLVWPASLLTVKSPNIATDGTPPKLIASLVLIT